MEDKSYGRETTLNRLKAVRDDHTKHPTRRLQADRNIEKIKSQLKDPKLNSMREQLIKASKAGDSHAVWKIENQIKAYEKRAIEKDE